MSAARKLKPGRFMLLTMGEGYSLDDGSCVPKRQAETLLFPKLDMQRKGAPALRANDDGLFPGFSQTWSVAAE